MKKITGLFTVLFLLPLLLFADQQDNADNRGDETRFHHYERFYIFGQPDLATLEQGRDEGVSIVINLRGETESDWNEEAAAESLGLAYYQVPVNAGAPGLAAGPFREINKIVAAHPESTILVHCASGNRAAAWLAVYLAEVQGLSTDQAVDIARSNGLTKKGLETKVHEFLDQ